MRAARVLAFARQGIVYAVLFVGITAFFIWWLKPQAPVAPDSAVSESATATPAPAAAGADRRTVGDAWRWDAFPEREAAQKAPPDAPPSLFDVPGIHQALREVELDEAGDVVVDGAALKQLQSAFASLDVELSAAQLEELQRIIRAGLPGPAGEQAAGIVRDYYRYHVALEDFEPDVGVSDELTAASIRYEQLVQLRHRHLGPETAERLFADEQAYARYVLESMRVNANPDLSQEQKNSMQARLRDSLPPGVLPDKPSTDWERRYAAFKRDKRAVLDAGLTESDKEAQIERLLREHFQEDEIEIARRYLPPPPDVAPEPDETGPAADDAER